MSSLSEFQRGLWNATYVGHYDRVVQIFETCPNINPNFPISQYGKTFLYKATQRYIKFNQENFFNIIKLLISRGANIDYVVEGNEQYEYISPFHLAVMKKHYILIEYFLQNGANPNKHMHETYHEPLTPLMMAIIFKDMNTLKLLLKHPKIDLTANNAYGMNALMYALTGKTCDGYEFYSEDIVDTLLKCNFVLTEKTTSEYEYQDTGITVMHIACLYERKEFLKKIFMWQDASTFAYIKNNYNRLPYETRISEEDEDESAVSDDMREFYKKLIVSTSFNIINNIISAHKKRKIERVIEKWWYTPKKDGTALCAKHTYLK